MQFSRGSLKMNFKWDMESNSDVKTVDFCRNKRVAEATMARLMQFEPKELYLGGLKIKGTKHKDLLGKLLKYVPPVHQEFYLRLKSDGTENEILLHPDYEEFEEMEEED